MRSGFRVIALGWLLAFCAGCGLIHKKAAPPPAAQAPTRPPAQMASLVPTTPPPLPGDKEIPVKLDTTTPPEAKTHTAVSPPPHSTHHRAKPAPQETAQQEPEKPPVQTPPPTPPEVATAQPSEMSPIGQLSTANDNTNTADRRAILDLVESTENGLNAIKRPLSSEEQKTAGQIRTFLTRARDALKADDLDGARTLSTKAHLLLEELIKE